MEEKYRHFLFGIAIAVGLCFIIFVFFMGDEVLKSNPAFLYFFLFFTTYISFSVNFPFCTRNYFCQF